MPVINITEDNNDNDNYNDIATITPMTTPIITPVLSSPPPPLASTENIICYMDTTKHLCIHLHAMYLQINLLHKSIIQ